MLAAPAAVPPIRNMNMALVASGAAPPAVSLVGPVPLPFSIVMKVILTGVLGVALVQISINGGPFGAPQLALGSVPVLTANLVMTSALYAGDEVYTLRVAA